MPAHGWSFSCLSSIPMNCSIRRARVSACFADRLALFSVLKKVPALVAFGLQLGILADRQRPFSMENSSRRDDCKTHGRGYQDGRRTAFHSEGLR